MFKRFARGSASLAFKLLIGLLALTTAMVVVFGNSNTLKSSLKESNIFEAAVENIIQENQDQAKKSAEDELPLQDPRIQRVIKDAFSGEFLESQSDNIIDGIYVWLNGEAAAPTFKIDLADAKTKLANGIGDAAVERVKALKTCTSQQLIELQGSDTNLYSLPCRPPSINLKAERAKIVNQIEGSDEFLKDTSFTAEDISKDQNGQTIFDKAESARDAYQWSKRMPWILGGLAIASIATVIFLHDDKRRGIFVLSRAFLIAGALLVVGVLISNYIVGKNEFINVESDNELQASTLLLARSLIQAFNRVLMTFGLVYSGLGAAGLIALHFTKPKGAAKAVDGANSNKGKPDTDQAEVEKPQTKKSN